MSRRLRKIGRRYHYPGGASVGATASANFALTDVTTLENQGSKATTPYFERDTVATEYDWEGLLYTAPAGAYTARGVRKEQNLANDDLAYGLVANGPTGSAWAKTGVTITEATGDVAPPDEVPSDTRVWRIQGTASLRRIFGTGTMGAIPVGNDIFISCWVKAVTPSTDDTFGFYVNNAKEGTDLTAGSDWGCFAHRESSITSSIFGLSSDSSDNDYDLYVCAIMFSDVTGRSYTSGPPEYVAPTGTGTSLVTSPVTAADWSAGGSNTKSDEVDGSVLITYVDNATASINLGSLYPSLLGGEHYCILYRAKVSSGSVQASYTGEVGAVTGRLIDNTSGYEYYSDYIQSAGSTLVMLIGGLGTGESVNVEIVSIKPMSHIGASDEGAFKYYDTQNGYTYNPTTKVVTVGTGDPIDSNLSGVASSVLGLNGAGPAGYRFWPSATNLALYSRTFTNAAWVASNMTVTDNAVTGIDGRTQAATLEATAGNATLIQDLGTISSAAKDFSVSVRRNTGSGTVELTLNGGSTWTAISVTSTWTRFDISATLADPDIGFRVVTSGDIIEVDFAQCEARLYPTPPIETTSTAATRDADICYHTPDDTSWLQTGGPFTVVCEAQWNDVAGTLIEISDQSVSDRIRLESDSSDRPNLVVDTASSEIVNITGSALTAGTAYQIAATLETDDFELLTDQSSDGTDTGGSLATNLTRIHIGSDYSEAGQNGVALANIQIFDSIKTTGQLLALESELAS